ncbi:MAG: DNA polymerase III subunit delta [Firmicutes bacterium]|nr:DNA polymerase III subunit delta [Bacillota bacterium]
MAYTKSPANTEHPSKTIVRMAASAEQTGIWPRAVLLCGKEDLLVDWSKAFLKEKIVSPAAEALDCVSFTGDGTDLYEVIAACETMPIFSARKMVIVDWPDLFGAQNPKGMDAESYKSLADYIPKLPESTLLLFLCQRPNKTRPLYKAIASCGIVYDFGPLDDATLSGWMAKRFRAAGKSASPKDLIAMARMCGYGDPDRNYTLHNLENDLKKILAASDKDVVTLDEMMEYAAPQAEQNAFKLLDSAFSGNKSAALQILGTVIDTQQPSKEVGAVMSFLGLLCSQLEIMLEAREREADGEDFYTIAGSMGTNEYRLRKAMSSSRTRTVKQLAACLDSAYQMEKDIKNGLMTPRMAMELFIAQL